MVFLDVSGRMILLVYIDDCRADFVYLHPENVLLGRMMVEGLGDLEGEGGHWQPPVEAQ